MNIDVHACKIGTRRNKNITAGIPKYTLVRDKRIILIIQCKM